MYRIFLGIFLKKANHGFEIDKLLGRSGLTILDSVKRYEERTIMVLGLRGNFTRLSR
ncbi:hypothetical protein LEP1GSC047_1052 [Leptospira inadai serovar Lyme str. 10]|uniref:Uncharacterized protein n=1 Tax=Leptospira inadai serovar Lyme str. 10 TaxID=1049790 RepID=V6HAH8_9LEPT|nr:hypothetical protein LEP1GSC047_1052 [Leptospira inadai serovar Lyme str. 10]